MSITLFTFGEEEKGKFGGILIRSLESLPIPTKPKILDGPCVCVDYILKENGSESIANFVEDFGAGARPETPVVAAAAGLETGSVQDPDRDIDVPTFMRRLQF